MTKIAYLRFYEELNDFLPEDKRKRRFDYVFEGGLTIADLLVRLGVPAGQVEIVLAEGDSVDLSHTVRNGEWISCYPVFESIDVRSLLRLRRNPLRNTRFVAGAGLGGLARYLRLYGFDTLDASHASDPEALRLSEEEGRVLLARQDRFPLEGNVSRAWRIRENKPRGQLIEVIEALDLFDSTVPLGRCPSCNYPLGDAAGSMQLERTPIACGGLPLHCANCGRSIAEGWHLNRLCRFLLHVFSFRRAHP